jgi:hypothetical protein
MTTQYKNPRLLLLGGALEYQSVVNQLASFNTLVQKVHLSCVKFFSFKQISRFIGMGI